MNKLIAALPAQTYEHWLPRLEVVTLRVGDVLNASGCTESHVYFPTTGVVSLCYLLENGASAEVAAVGQEGIVGVSTFMGGHSSPSQSVVQNAGSGLRLLKSTVLQAFEQGGAVTRLLLLYTQALMTQIALTAACNRHHSLDQRLCRLLLFSLDRGHSQELRMTQELLASLLGVRREGVTVAALALQQQALIRYQRGHITVIDRIALERRSCECYAVVAKEYRRLLPDSLGRTRQTGL